MRQINLLPAEFKPGRKISDAVKKLEKPFIFFLVIYLISLGGSIAFSKYIQNKFDELNSQKRSLSEELKSLTEIESATVYIRDRVEKYKSIPQRDTEMKTLEDFDHLYSVLPEESSVGAVNISNNTAVFSVALPNTPVFIEFLDILTSSEIYKDALLTSLSFSQDRGYQFNLALTR